MMIRKKYTMILSNSYDKQSDIYMIAARMWVDESY